MTPISSITILLFIQLSLAVSLSLNDMKPTRTERRNHELLEEVNRTINSTCCSRHRKETVIGFGMSGDLVEIDVGHCRKSCKSSHIDSLAKLLQPGKSEDEENSYLQRTCPIDWACAEKSSRVERVSTLYGIQEVTVIEECECREKPHHCSRQSHSVTLYPGSPFQTTLDVGTCSGHCALGGCKPVRNKTVNVPGPNGSRCYSVIQECGCAGGCYRASLMETVYDYSTTDDSTDITDEPDIKEIDVGRCVGSCVGIQTGKCLFRDQADPSKCLSVLYSKQTNCSPSKFQIHRYTNKQNESKEIVSIVSCKCM